MEVGETCICWRFHKMVIPNCADVGTISVSYTASYIESPSAIRVLFPVALLPCI